MDGFVMANTELDKIINEGKVSPSIAMVVFAAELKVQGDRIDELKNAINNDNTRYATKDELQKLDRRVGRLENAILGVLGFVFLTVVGALITLVLKQGGS